ncbi:MAG: Gfo/Idh/MocA family oxidoreductase [Acetatifactor sp.]|nr:Gfo/Idh/MocA family oxidoreductase [Acetatifactor sp.]
MTKVITYGTYDLFHEGHYNILKRARELGDYLIVGVTTEHYDQQRGKINVVDSLLDRIENVRKTGLADQIIIEDHEGQKIEDIQKYQVDIFAMGSDRRGMFDYLKPLCQVVYLDRTPGISTIMLRREKFPIIRTGIVGTGRIAPRFVAEAKYVSGLHICSAYNPHRDSVQQFASEMGLEGFSDSFEEFLDSVDAIYIAAPHETHYDYAKRALLQGKHVLCEKPLAFSRREAKELFAIARENHAVLMEGIKTAYCPGFTQIINIAKSGKIGEIRDVEACFSRLTTPALREMADFQYGGAFLEFGSYTLLPIIKLLGADYKRFEINSIPAENGVDLYTKILFSYENGLAMSKTGIGVKSEGQLLISGTKGYILAESPWWLTKKFQIRYEDPAQIETYTPNFMGDGLRYEIGEFVTSINGNNGYSYRLTEQDSVAMAGVVEAFMEERARQLCSFRGKNRASGVKIWAHRGCCYRYPENTLPAFEAACRIPGIAGIELDIQLSKDGEIMVFHDETLNRLMGVDGNLRDYTCQELQQMRFQAWDYEEKPSGGREESDGRNLPGGEKLDCESGSDRPVDTRRMYIPRMEEVLSLVKPYSASTGAMINIELKNGGVRYEGMEEKILALVKKYDMESHVLYSSFNPESLRMLKELNAGVSTGILAGDVRECVRMEAESLADALHPSAESISEYGVETGSAGETVSQTVYRPVRGWNGREPFYKERRWPVQYDLCALAKKGMTDFITNVPEEYLRED